MRGSCCSPAPVWPALARGRAAHNCCATAGLGRAAVTPYPLANVKGCIMPLASTPRSYGGPARLFHWLTALLIVTAAALGLCATGLPTGSPEQVAAAVTAFSAHKTIGVAAFFVALARILWAVTQPRPAPLHPARRLETLAAETVHWALYGAMLVMPLSGWVKHAAQAGFAPIWGPFGQGLPFVPQSAALFSGSVRENIRWGKPDASDEEIWQALSLAQVKEAVEEKGGLDTLIEQGGRNLSGGQKQRLTVARALVRNPEILILDDSASALDYATDAALRKSIRHMEGNPTVFIVSQRASSVLYADQILVLDDGRAVGLGTSEELLASCPVYQEIYGTQFEREAAHA
ncbi:MAG: ATP-binding cassette domain-containing protein [Clostridia bacterium]|nr:ATP-binding cassette domain-containing protein [Clostridia bacterium]